MADSLRSAGTHSSERQTHCTAEYLKELIHLQIILCANLTKPVQITFHSQNNITYISIKDFFAL